MSRHFLRDLYSDWVALVIGGAPFILAVVAVIYRDTLPALLFWPTAYACLAIVGYRLWAQDAGSTQKPRNG